MELEGFNEEQLQRIHNYLASQKTKWKQESEKQQELTDEQKEIQRLKGELLQQKVVSAFKNANLEDLAGLVTIADEAEIETKLAQVTSALNKQQSNTSFKPEQHRTTNDRYREAEKAGDVTGMIDAKIAKLYQ